MDVFCYFPISKTNLKNPLVTLYLTSKYLSVSLLFLAVDLPKSLVSRCYFYFSHSHVNHFASVSPFPAVTESVCAVSSCSLLKSQVGGKESLLHFRCQQLEGRVTDICPKADDPPPPPRTSKVGMNWARTFIDRSGRWLHAETTLSSLTVIFRLVLSGLAGIIMFVLDTVNLQFQGPFFPISLRPVLGIVAALVIM